MVADLPNPFWEYSLQLYAQQGVEPCCLAWQDNDDVNVNLLLFCCWSGLQGVALDIKAVEGCCLAIAGPDAALVQPLRKLRRQISGQAGENGSALYSKLLEAQLLAERQVQDALYQHFLELKGSSGAPISAAQIDPDSANALSFANLAVYFSTLGLRIPDNDHALVRAVKSVNMQTLQSHDHCPGGG